MKRGWQTEYGIVSRARERERETTKTALNLSAFSKKLFSPGVGRWLARCIEQWIFRSF